jgi:tRNA A-37 threonylcarbamoyl transferase component Bud32
LVNIVDREVWQLDGTCRATRLMSERLRSDIIECDGVAVIKLYSRDVEREQVEEEVRLTNLARGTGIRAPRIMELLEDSGRWGFSYQKLDGPTYLDLMLQGGRSAEELGRSMALVHRELHEHCGPGMPALKDRLRATISECRGRKELRAAALRSLDRLPDGDQVCHGDFHPGNVIVTREGSYVLDWIDASAGHYLADVARSVVLIYAWLPNQLQRMGGTPSPGLIGRFCRSYRTHAYRSTPENDEMVDRWMLPVAVARLCQDIPGEEDRLMRIIERIPAERS